MKFKDPFDVVCPKCGCSLSVAVADLLALTANCIHCGASLSEIGVSMRQSREELWYQWLFVQVIMELEDEFSVPIPDQVAANLVESVKTKVKFVDAFVPYLGSHGCKQASVKTVSAAFDRAMARIGYTVPVPESISLFEDHGRGTK